MTKYLFIAQSDCSDKTREAEFTEWMDNVHVPDILNVTGIISAARYENINPEGTKRPKNMIMYEIEIDDINKFYAALDNISKEIEASGRVVDTIVPEKAYPFAPPIYKQVQVYKVPPKK
jgi:hypothetical protein